MAKPWGKHGCQWTRNQILDAFYQFFCIHDRWPTFNDLQPRTRPAYLPSQATVHRTFGGLDHAAYAAELRHGQATHCQPTT